MQRVRTLAACLASAMGLAALVPAVPGRAQDAAPALAPKMHTHLTRPSSRPPAGTEALRRIPARREIVHTDARTENTGAGVVYTCDSNVAASTCDYLNTTVAGYYRSIFTNANASIYILYGSTGLGQSNYYYNFVTYPQYVSALSANANPTPLQVSALAALNQYDATPYGGDNVEISAALGEALGFTGMTGTTVDGKSCTLPAAGCYNAIVTVISDPQDYGFSLYYDDQGGTEPSNAYDFYAVVEHETDEVLGTTSCIDTQSSNLSDGCDAGDPNNPGVTGEPSVSDLFRYASSGHLVLDSSLSTAAGAYFSFDGGSSNGWAGLSGAAKVYNTLSNGDDYADLVSSSPDCGTDEAVQDAEGCPGEDAGMTILNDGGGEINNLTAVGYTVPFSMLPTPSSKLTGSSTTFSWSPVNNASYYWVYVGSTGVGSSNLYNSNQLNSSTTSVTATGLPTNGSTIYVRLWAWIDGGWVSRDFTYTASTAASNQPATLTSPTQGSTLPGPTTTFTWTAPAGATAYQFWLGSTGRGSANLLSSGILHTNSTTRTTLPTNGEPLYGRIYTDFNGTWTFVDYTFSAAAQAAPISPAASTTLVGPTQTFTWTTATGNPGAYEFWLGTGGVGSNNILSSGILHTTSVTRVGLPVNGETLYARLYTDYNGTWVHQDYTLTTAKEAMLTSPAPGGTLGGSSVQFTWSAATAGATQYQLWLGTSGAGSDNLYSSGTTTATTVTVNNLPTAGHTIYARLYTNFNGTWSHIDYTLTEAP